MSLTNMTMEELETLSYTKIAEMYLQENKKTLSTNELFKEVCNLLQMTEDEYADNITDFFQSLSTTKEFILIDGKWDLKSNHKVKVNIEELYEDKDEDEELLEEENEELDDIEADILDDDDFDPSEDEDFMDDDLSDLSIVDEDDLDKDE